MRHIFVEVMEEPMTGGWTAWGYEMPGRPGRYENAFENRATVVGKNFTYHIRSNDFLLKQSWAIQIAKSFHKSARKVDLRG